MSSQVTKRGNANLALHNLLSIPHREPECHQVGIIPNGLSSRQRHEPAFSPWSVEADRVGPPTVICRFPKCNGLCHANLARCAQSLRHHIACIRGDDRSSPMVSVEARCPIGRRPCVDRNFRPNIGCCRLQDRRPAIPLGCGLEQSWATICRRCENLKENLEPSKFGDGVSRHYFSHHWWLGRGMNLIQVPRASGVSH
jgi:hypothetical protein